MTDNRKASVEKAALELSDDELDAAAGGARPKSEDTERREWREKNWVRYRCGYCGIVGYNADFNEEESNKRKVDSVIQTSMNQN